MTDLATRLRNWREVHLARLHLLMEEAADEMERLSSRGDCPKPDNAAKQDNDERLAALQALAALDEELGLPSRTPATHATPSEGIEQNGCRLTDAERADRARDFPRNTCAASRHAQMVAEAMAAGVHGDDLRDAGSSILSVVASLWESRTAARLRATPDTPSTLTDAEREAVSWCVEMAVLHATDCDDEIATLRGLLERLP